MKNWAAIRNNYPLVENATYLNTPLLGAMSRSTHERAQSLLDEFLYDGPLNYEAWNFELEAARENAGRLLNTAAKNIAFVGDVATGMNFLSQMLLDLKREVVIYEKDFPSVALPWLNQQHKVVKISANSQGMITPELLKKTFTPQTGVLVLSFVQYNTGFKIELEAIGKLCREQGILFVVDATQALGAFPIDIQLHNIDVLLASTYKWALGGYGTALFYANPNLIGSHFPAVGWHSLSENLGIPDLKNVKQSIASLEIGHPKFNNVLMAGTALKEILDLGVAAIEARIKSLTLQLHQGLREKGIAVLSAFEEKNLSGITMIPGTEAQVLALRRKNIHVSYRGNSIRLGLHFYNNKTDIEHLLSEL